MQAPWPPSLLLTLRRAAATRLRLDFSSSGIHSFALKVEFQLTANAPGVTAKRTERIERRAEERCTFSATMKSPVSTASRALNGPTYLDDEEGLMVDDGTVHPTPKIIGAQGVERTR
jgi:hypothetical protein